MLSYEQEEQYKVELSWTEAQIEKKDMVVDD